MTPDIVGRLQALREEIEEHNHRYYVLDQPTIADSEFDALFRELLALEAAHPELTTPDSPSQRVGAAPAAAFAAVSHRAPMLSLNNAFHDADVIAFDRRAREALGVAEIEYAAEPKFDGLAISLTYQHGRFAGGATRGDGSTGEDVTANLRTIRAIPLRLPDAQPPAVLEVRGEVIMLKRDFEKLNDEQRARNEKPFAESAQRRRREPAPARPEGDGAASAQLLRLRHRGGGGGIGALGEARSAARLPRAAAVSRRTAAARGAGCRAPARLLPRDRRPSAIGCPTRSMAWSTR